MTDDCGRCWKCKEGRGCIRSVQLDPRATPSRTRRGVPHTPDPAWERGIPTDDRGMPQLRPDLSPMGIKEFGQKRSLIEEAKRKAANVPAT